jgi:murein DD-endopeptidase MepM/ murein hydrolase activator NlpD
MKGIFEKHTLVVISDANRPVIRLRLPVGFLLIASGAAAVILLGAAITFFALYFGNSGRIGHLRYELASSTERYEQLLADKDAKIEDLQTDVAGLSEQAKTVQNRIADIRKLESDLKQMAGLEGKNPSADIEAADAGDSDSGYSMDGGGTGGEDLPVTDEEMDALIQGTKGDFQALDRLLQALKPEMEQTKQAVVRQQKRMAATPTLWPTVSHRITSPFGVRKDPFTRRAGFHAGIDIGGDVGDPVYAAADGTVVLAERDETHGNNVWIDHGNGFRTRYLHLSRILTKPGAKVRKGDLIGELGSTGRSTGPHLHYEVSINGRNIDPRPYMLANPKGD